MNCSTDTTPENILMFNTPGITPYARIIYGAGECHVTIYEHSILSQCKCVSNKVFTCVSKRLNRMKHGDLLECNVLGGTASNYIRIDIQVPVQYASIPRDIPDRLTVDENKLASLTCQANGIPAANITWFWDNSNLSTLVEDVQIVDNISQGIKVESDKTFSVTSNLTLNVNRSHNRRVIYCRARNLNSELKTILPTTGILISGGRDFYMIRNSPTIQRLECSVEGGNPYADLHWSCYNGNQTKFNDSSGAISTVTWKAELHNDSICTCSASHDLGWTNPPTPPFIQINMCRNMSVPNGSFINVLRGDQVDIDCSSSGNPPPTYFWSDSLQSSKLLIQNMSEHLAFEYFCTASNNMDASYGKNPPKITKRTTPVVVLEGSNFSLSCDSKPGNPNATSFVWTSTEQPYRNTSGQNFTIQNISRTEEGVFTCVAENIMHPTGCPEVHGRDMENVHVDVQYKASIKTFTALNTTVNHGENLTFACDVDSDPPASITIVSPTGARLEYIKENNKLHYSKSSSCLDDRDDASRVVLPCIRWDPDSDFINASYIDGYCKPRKYIAAQGPLENTISDTWRMIHSEDIKIIVMVTNIMEVGKKKCSKYWPDDRAIYGKCNVKLDQVEEYADFVVRHFTYNMEGTRFERQLIQFHYTSWPDKNVPATALSLVQFWRKVRQCEFVENTPWMVHCSAGVGRTGSFIALDVLYEQGKVDGKLNIPDTVNVLREQRISMVQTKEQYLYLHEVITELLDPIGQIINPENSLKLQSTVAEDKTLKKEFKAITESIASVKTEESDFDFNRMPDGLLPENMCKSIDMNVIPDDIYRPLLSSGNDFINAVYIPTYRENEKYIVTQFPLQNTVNDFVRLLWDHNIRDVVLLDQENNERHCYWPHTKNPLCLGPFVISLLTVDEATNCTTRIIDITLAKKRQSKQTVVHQFTAWPGYLNLCEQETLADFLQTISSIAGPVVVQCHDGYSRSGLFAALLCTVDRIKTDNEVAIADTVRLVKHRRKAAVTDMEQYTFCHEIVSEYLRNRERLTEENQEYVNMTLPKLL
ncbi:PTPRT-like protein [Mya arenaria]|uniref:protein-tyrosine-phosphatase n=1 Tax=Mya arenaria TaxID=6604 RepID=A0ABY7E5A1_MYAAR|nr:PTPRT-like protein [Mya arenaria]